MFEAHPSRLPLLLYRWSNQGQRNKAMLCSRSHCELVLGHHVGIGTQTIACSELVSCTEFCCAFVKGIAPPFTMHHWNILGQFFLLFVFCFLFSLWFCYIYKKMEWQCRGPDCVWEMLVHLRIRALNHNIYMLITNILIIFHSYLLRTLSAITL